MNNDTTAVVLRPMNPETLIAQAIEKGVDVATMERLLAMRRELKAEAAKESFDRALAEFQSSCPTIQKTKKVLVKGALRYCYAPLEDIVRQVKSLLRQHGFSYTLDAVVEPGWVTATCKLTHSFGHHETSQFKVPIQQDAYMGEAQKFASALTFAKRYAFVNSLGILTGDEDDDSHGAQDEHPHSPPARQQSTPEPQKKSNPLPEVLKEAKARFIENVRKEGKLFDAWVYLVETGTILDTEQIEEARVEVLFPSVKEDLETDAAKPLLKSDYDRMMSDIRAHTILESQHGAWQEQFTHAYNENKKKPAKKVEVPREPNPKRDGPFWGVICPIPRKGQKRDDYLKHPDTIQSLYDAAKDGVEDAGKRLFGFANNWKPEAREYNGKTYPATVADHNFREALDEFLQWHEENKLNET